MIGSLIGGLVGGAASIFGGMSASKAMKEYYNTAKENNRAKQAQNEAWYNRRYNEPATERADAQALLTRTEEMIRDRNKAAQGRQAVMGGTEESVATTKDANADAMAQAASNIVAASEARKDRIEDQYMSRSQQLTDEATQLEGQKQLGKAQNVATATQAVGQFAGGLGEAMEDNGFDSWFSGLFKKSNNGGTPQST